MVALPAVIARTYHPLGPAVYGESVGGGVRLRGLRDGVGYLPTHLPQGLAERCSLGTGGIGVGREGDRAVPLADHLPGLIADAPLRVDPALSARVALKVSGIERDRVIDVGAAIPGVVDDPYRTEQLRQVFVQHRAYRSAEWLGPQIVIGDFQPVGIDAGDHLSPVQVGGQMNLTQSNGQFRAGAWRSGAGGDGSENVIASAVGHWSQKR